ncbi:MAG: efflux RND transporter periplasmic adaptor subunit [Tannerellaceae bacterium]|jgi:cobalt-zinc-cadmium efflux system membrane fusion protein|nr:efflux RND transporter periplasmic adaptor subunit [Tannerellaceae bacterium]
MNKIFIVTMLCLLTASCKQHNPDADGAGIRYAGDTIVVPAGSPIMRQILTRQAGAEEYSAEFRTVGSVRPVQGRLAEIASPFAGRILRSYVRLGQAVGAGAPIVELGSAEFYEAARTYFASRSAKELKTMHFDRQKDLAAHGVASQRDLEEARSEAEIAARELEEAEATLQLFHTEASSLQMGQPLRLVSPIAGEVVKSNITIGSYAAADAGPLAVVADLSEVWVAALVKEKYFGAIRHGDRVEVFTDANPGHVVWGHIYYIGEMLDEETRSLEVIVACNNSDRELKPGMFCEVHFLSSPVRSIILPSTAVMQEQDHAYVLIKTPGPADATGYSFVRREVESETAGDGKVRIASGLSEGDEVVVEGGIYLNL